MNRTPTTRRRWLQGRLAQTVGLAGLACCAGPGARAEAAPTAEASPSAPADDVLDAAAARADLALLQQALFGLHPGLQRHTAPAQLQAAFDAAQAAVAGGCDRAGLFVHASRIAARVGCGHTWANPSNQRADVQRAVFGRSDQLPLTLRVVEGRVGVTASAAPGVEAGDELLTIDGRPLPELMAALLPLLRADGWHAGALGKRRSQLDSGANGGAFDRLLPLLSPPVDGQWRVQLQRGNALHSVVLPATSATRLATALPRPAPAWSLRIDGDTGVLTLPTLAFWNTRFDARAELQRHFDALRGTRFLVIDLRDCEGGDDSIGRALLAQLIDRPVTLPGSSVESAYISAAAALRPLLGTWDPGFFERSGQVTTAPSRHPGRNHRLADRPATTVLPLAQRYRGRCIALVGPQNSSAGFLLARDLQDSGAARLIGQPTGGHRQGLNSGQLCWLTLPASGVAVDIPLLAAYTQGEAQQVDAGVLPDQRVAPRWADWQAGIDTEMQAARAVLAQWRSG